MRSHSAIFSVSHFVLSQNSKHANCYCARTESPELAVGGDENIEDAGCSRTRQIGNEGGLLVLRE